MPLGSFLLGLLLDSCLLIHNTLELPIDIFQGHLDLVVVDFSLGSLEPHTLAKECCKQFHIKYHIVSYSPMFKVLTTCIILFYSLFYEQH